MLTILDMKYLEQIVLDFQSRLVCIYLSYFIALGTITTEYRYFANIKSVIAFFKN